MNELLVLPKDKRISLFKIECESEILFSDWKPDGKVYTKQLILKNVSNSLLTLTYKLPTVACFFTPYPDQIVLPIGMSYSINVSFQPVDRNEQQAYLTFHVNQYNDDFNILLRGELPLLSAKIEPRTYFPVPTAVNEETEHSVVLENDGEIPMLFEFSLLDSSPLQPFHISPRFGHVLTGESLKITYRFSPKQSGQLTSKVNMRIKKTDADAMAKKDYIDYPLLLTATAKFPYFVVKCDDVAVDELEFTDVSILSEPMKNVFIENQSDVSTKFQILRELASDKPLDQILIQPTEGIIPPRSSFPIKVTFRPYFSQSFNQIDCGDALGREDEFNEQLVFHNHNPHDLRMRQTFKIQSSSLIMKDMNVVCQVQPAQMEITASKIDFGTIKCGDKVQKSFYVKNNTRFDCPYQFVIEGFSGSENMMSAECYADQGLIQFGDNQNDITNIPAVRSVALYPLYVYPSSGVASSQINTTINVVLDLSKYTTKQLTLKDKYDGKSYIPPQPISTYIQYKTPGSPIQFIHVTATIIPDTGDYRSAPITMDYAEKFHDLRREYTIDKLYQNLIACNGKHPNAKLSPLYNESFVEFETEATKTIKISEQSLNKYIINYDPHEEEHRMRANALLPSDAIMVEFNGLRANFNEYASDISDRFYNFGFVQAGTQQQKIIVVTNKSDCLSMAVAVAGQQNRKGMKLDFLGISDVYEVTSLRSLRPTNITPSDGLDVHTCASRGLTVLVPPAKYAYFQVTCSPDIVDEYYYASYTFFCTHQPLLLYRCFRHAVVGYGDVREVRVLASSRDVVFPALASTVPVPTRPVVDGYLKLPPTTPGSVTRQTFALVNNSTSSFTVSLAPLKQSYINVYPQCALMTPHSTLVISVAVTFPTDALLAKERYGLEGVKGKSQSAMFENELVFNINNSKQTVIKVGLVAICSSIDVTYDCAGVEIPVFGEIERCSKMSTTKKITTDLEAALAESNTFGDDNNSEDEGFTTSKGSISLVQCNKYGPAYVQMKMAPVSLCSEGLKLFTFVNKSFLPVNIISQATDSLQQKYACITEPDILMAGCEEKQLQLLLQAKDQWLHEGPLTLNIGMNAELPRQFCAPTPYNFNVFAENTNTLINNYNQLVIQGQISKRTIQVEPHTINLKNIVPYEHVDIQLKVKNNSHCQIAYTLEIHEIKEYMPKLDFEAVQLPMRKYAYEIGADQGEYLVPVLYNKVNDPEGVMSPDVQARCPQVFIKQGAGNVVLPHNEATVLLSVRPHDSTPVRLRVFAKIVEIETVDRQLGEVLHELENEACYIQGDTKSFQQYYQNHLDREKMVESKIEVQTCYPKFFITDISCPKIGSSQLRDILNVDRINDFLAQPVTMNERIYNTPGSKRDQLIAQAEAAGKLRLRQFMDEDAFKPFNSASGSMGGSGRPTSRGSSLDGSAGEMLDHEIEEKVTASAEADEDQDELLLTEFPLILGPDNQSESRRYFVTLTLSNPEEIPCAVSLDLPKGLDLNDVPWATQLPNLRKQRTMSLLARHIYSVAPQEIILAPGEKRSVSISYSHIEEGVHELSVLCKINGGRTFFLHLIGSTLSKFEPAIIAPIEQKLLPIPLGEKIPPRQFLKIYNPGQVYIKYNLANPRLIFDILDEDDEIDEPLEESPWTNVHTVLDCLNPEGMIAPDSALDIILQFKPNQVGLVHIQYDICITKVSQSTYEAYMANHTEKKYFANEMSGELLSGRKSDYNDVMASDFVGSIEILDGSGGAKGGKDSNGKPPPGPQLMQTNFLNSQNPLVNNVYQTLDLFAYGFVRSTSIPTQIMPSYCKNGSPNSPACGAVALQNIALAKRSGLITQRGLGYAELSCGRLVFGAVPVFSRVSSVITVKALPQKRPGHIRFSVDNLPSSTDFKIRASPQSGTLKYGEEVEVALIVETGALPSAFLHDIAFVVEFVADGPQHRNAFSSQAGAAANGSQRLPTVLANTVASAARVAETAILQRFNPVEINRAGLDQQPRQAHAMLYGVEDYVSVEKTGPLSQYQEIPNVDVVWLTVNIHSHRQAQINLYDNQFYGIMPNTRFSSFEKKKIAFDRPKQSQQLNMADQLQLESIVKLTLRDSINQLIGDKSTMRAANRARRDVINGLQKVNFFDTHDNDLVGMIDDQVYHNKKTQLGTQDGGDSEEVAAFLDMINGAFYDEVIDL